MYPLLIRFESYACAVLYLVASWQSSPGRLFVSYSVPRPCTALSARSLSFTLAHGNNFGRQEFLGERVVIESSMTIRVIHTDRHALCLCADNIDGNTNSRIEQRHV